MHLALSMVLYECMESSELSFHCLVECGLTLLTFNAQCSHRAGQLQRT